MMSSNKLKFWATPLVIGTSLFVVLSGFMLFFHIGYDIVVQMHEWLGMLLMVAVIAHAKLHFKSIKIYLSRRNALLLILVVSVIGISFITTAIKNDGTRPITVIISTLENASIGAVAGLIETSPSEAMTKLIDAGITVNNSYSTIADIAHKNKIHSQIILNILFKEHY